MGFRGWPPGAVEFFRGLQADNTKDYWTAHRQQYEASVREPMAALLDELSGEFGPGRIARPYRDVRFRADKSPYKTQIYATLDRGGYVNFSAAGLNRAGLTWLLGSGRPLLGSLMESRMPPFALVTPLKSPFNIASDGTQARLAFTTERIRVAW